MLKVRYTLGGFDQHMGRVTQSIDGWWGWTSDPGYRMSAGCWNLTRLLPDVDSWTSRSYCEAKCSFTGQSFVSWVRKAIKENSLSYLFHNSHFHNQLRVQVDILFLCQRTCPQTFLIIVESHLDQLKFGRMKAYLSSLLRKRDLILATEQVQICPDHHAEKRTLEPSLLSFALDCCRLAALDCCLLGRSQRVFSCLMDQLGDLVGGFNAT